MAWIEEACERLRFTLWKCEKNKFRNAYHWILIIYCLYEITLSVLHIFASLCRKWNFLIRQRPQRTICIFDTFASLFRHLQGLPGVKTFPYSLLFPPKTSTSFMNMLSVKSSIKSEKNSWNLAVLSLPTQHEKSFFANEICRSARRDTQIERHYGHKKFFFYIGFLFQIIQAKK